MRNEILSLKAAVIAVIALLFVVLGQKIFDSKPQKIDTAESYVLRSFEVIEIDSCEYVISKLSSGYSICHKGNCKHCIARKAHLD